MKEVLGNLLLKMAIILFGTLYFIWVELINIAGYLALVSAYIFENEDMWMKVKLLINKGKLIPYRIFGSEYYNFVVSLVN